MKQSPWSFQTMDAVYLRSILIRFSSRHSRLKEAGDVTFSYEEEIKGTGYGMANVKKYVELHNGTIAVNSIAGQGTEIKLSFPLIRKELTKKEMILLKNVTTQTHKRILLVEDEFQIAQAQYSIFDG